MNDAVSTSRDPFKELLVEPRSVMYLQVSILSFDYPIIPTSVDIGSYETDTLARPYVDVEFTRLPCSAYEIQSVLPTPSQSPPFCPRRVVHVMCC